MRVHPDTNVLLSAFFGHGLCSQLFELLLETGQPVLIGEPVAREFVRIARDKFQVNDSALSLALEVLARQERIATSEQPTPVTIPDPDDVAVVATALAGSADVLVTDDAELLALGKVGEMAILSPRRLWTRIYDQPM